jgi:Bacterial Ig-like domain
MRESEDHHLASLRPRWRDRMRRWLRGLRRPARSRERRRAASRFSGCFLENRVLLSLGVTFSDGVLTIAGNPFSPNKNNTFNLQVDGIFHRFLQFTVDGELNLSLLSTLDQIVVKGNGGDDQLNIDVSNGLINVPISYDGGTGVNTLTLNETTSVAPQTSEFYDVGASAGSGIDTIVGPSGTQTVEFQNLAPVTSLVPAGSLTVEPAQMSLFGVSGSLLNGPNAISYGQGPSPAFGQITVDSAEPIVFANKGALIINTGPGADTISLNDPGTPSGSPIGNVMQSITVTGGDPSAGDTLVVNATPTVSPDPPDALELTPSGAGAGTISHARGLNPPVTFTGMGHLRFVGQAAGGNVFGVGGTVGDDQFELTPGASPDSGSVTGALDENNATGLGPFALTPISFSGVSRTQTGPGLAAPGIFFNTANQLGGADSLVYNGTGGNDLIALAGGAGPSISLKNTVNGLTYSTLFADHLSRVLVKGNGGDDSASVNGVNVPATIESVPTLLVKGSGDRGLTVDLGAQTVQETGFALITAQGTETFNVDASGRSLTIDGPTGANNLTYTPTGPQSGRVTSESGGFTTNFSNVAGAFTIDPKGGAGGVDQVTVQGSQVNDVIVATGGASPTVQVNAFKALGIVAANTAGLRVLAGGGDDAFVLNNSAGAFATPITLDGGTGSNQMILSGGTASSDVATFSPAAGSGASTLIIGGVTQSVSYTNLNALVDVVAGPLVVKGTASNDSVNYQGVPSASMGIVTVNDFTPLEFANKSGLIIDSGSGDDTINIDNPDTPSGLGAIAVLAGSGDDSLVINARGRGAVVGVVGTISVVSSPPVVYRDVEQVSVRNVGASPLSTAPASIRGVVGVPLIRIVTGTFSGSLAGSSAPTLTATIDWGDGSAPSGGQVVALGGGQFEVLGSHTFSKVGNPTVTTALVGPGGSSTQVVGGVPVTVTGLGGIATTIVSPDVVINSSARGSLTGQLNPASDHGLSNDDAITNDNRPTFIGTFEPRSTVTLTAQSLTTGALVTLGQGTTNAQGGWTIDSTILADDRYVIVVSAFDQVNQVSATTVLLPASHPLVIDTVGPKVVSAVFDRTTGHVTLVLGDDSSGLDPTRVSNRASYSLTRHGVPNGLSLSRIAAVSSVVRSGPETVALTYNRGRPSASGVYTFTVKSSQQSSGLRDVAGNALDGEFSGALPSGDGVAGGAFVAKFDTLANLIASATPPTIIIVGNPPPPTTIVVKGVNAHAHKRVTPPRNVASAKGAAAHDAALAQMARRHGRR